MTKAVARTLRLLVFVLASACSGTGATADDYETRRAELIKGLPDEVVSVINRVVLCNHWAGEDPYDNERATQIQAAVTELRCATVDADALDLARRYGASSATARALDQAREWTP